MISWYAVHDMSWFVLMANKTAAKAAECRRMPCDPKIQTVSGPIQFSEFLIVDSAPACWLLGCNENEAICKCTG